MARKILIATSFIIAVFPYLGFSQSVDVSVTTTLGLLMAAVLLLSRKPKTRELEEEQPEPTDTPSPFQKEMHSLPVNHQKEDTIHPSHIAIDHKQHIETPVGKNDEHMKPIAKVASTPASVQEKRFIPEVADGIALPTRRARKQAPRVILAQEDQVHPADIPVPAEVQAQMHGETQADTF